LAGEADVYADLFEPSSALAIRLRRARPFASGDEVIAAARRLATQLTEEERVATLNAHPRIGEDPTRLSARSLAEQGDEQRLELARLNDEYESRFGFRFVTFVNRRTQGEIAEELRRRLDGSPEEEMAAGLEAIIAIAASRAARKRP
jgi:2-oxo-4-hydroxy-4-carboxy--5-ureidoimidazoline (OHCU) decarboxylase